jgi:hypothetical protein
MSPPGLSAPARNFLDQTGDLWMKGSLVGKVGSVFTSTGTQHGGQETTITDYTRFVIRVKRYFSMVIQTSSAVSSLPPTERTWTRFPTGPTSPE